MTFVGIFGILIGLLAALYAFVRPTRLTVVVFVALFAVHVLSAVIYHTYAQYNPSDSELYYFDPADWYHTETIKVATVFVVFLVQWLKSLFGGTYLDYFLLFQAAGFAGLALMLRIFQEIYGEVGTQPPSWAYLFLFLPGLHFWTSMIGKDVLLFLAVTLSLWSAMNLRRRYLFFAGAVLLMVIVRPHIAVAAAAAVSLTLFFDRRTGRFMRFALLIVALGGMVGALTTLQTTFRFDVTDAESVSDFLASRDAATQGEAGGSTGVRGSFPVRFASLLFRPFFIDAEGLFGLLASFENVVLIPIYAFILWNLREVRQLAKAAAFVRYAAVFSITVALMLTLVYYNVGLGLRQRTMIIPGLLVVLVTLLAVRHARRVHVRETTAHAAMPVAAGRL